MRHIRYRLATLALGLAIAPPLWAQTEAAAQLAREEQRAALLEQAAQEQDHSSYFGPVLDTQFAGGTLGDYIEAVERAAGADAPTVMIRGDAEGIRVAPVDLRQIHMFSAIQLLDGDHMGADNETPYGVRSVNVGAPSGGRPAYLVTVQGYGRSKPGAPERDFMVLPIRQITEALPGDPPEIVIPAETVLTAVETVIAIADPEGSATEIRFHPESGLLMLAGPSKALVAAEQVLGQITRDVEQRRDRARELQRAQGLTNPEQLEQQLADARAEAEMAAVRMDTAQQRSEGMAQRAEEMQKLAEAGSTSEGELRQARMELAESEAQVQEGRIIVERAMQRVQQFEKQLERSKQIVSGGGSGAGGDALREENAMLRDRLAVLEAQIAKLNEELKGRAGPGAGTGRSGR